MPPRKSHLRFLVPCLMIVVGLGLFIAVAADVTHHGRLQQADQVIAPYLYARESYWLVFLAAAFSGLGHFWILLPLALVIGGLLIRRKRWRALLVWAVGLLGSMQICGALKNYFAIPRPSHNTPYSFLDDPGFSFPSGHTMGATVAAGLLTLIWMHWRPRPRGQRWAAGLLAGTLGTFTATSLLYIGVHYLTDVLGGLAISLAWLGALRLLLPPAMGIAGATNGAYDERASGEDRCALPPITPGETPDARKHPEQIDCPADT